MNGKLSSGERVVRCLTGGDIDRAPYGTFLGWSPWQETYDRWKKESGDESLNVYKLLDFEASFEVVTFNIGMCPPFEEVLVEEDDTYRTWIDGRGIKIRNYKYNGSIPEYLEYPVKNPSDWERVKKERFNKASVERYIHFDWEEFKARVKSNDAAVQVGYYPYGMFGAPRDLMGAEELLVAFYDEPDMIKDMIDTLTDLWIHLYSIAAEHIQIDHLHIWEDMSGRQGSLISMDMVDKFMMPAYDKMADFAKSNNVRLISVDTDGDCAELVEIMTKHGVNAFMPFEVQAGNDILKYREEYPELGIVGGLDKRALAQDFSAIDKELEIAEKMIKLGRYAPCFDHLIPPDVPWINFKYAAKKMRELIFDLAK